MKDSKNQQSVYQDKYPPKRDHDTLFDKQDSPLHTSRQTPTKSVNNRYINEQEEKGTVARKEASNSTFLGQVCYHSESRHNTIYYLIS